MGLRRSEQRRGWRNEIVVSWKLKTWGFQESQWCQISHWLPLSQDYKPHLFPLRCIDIKSEIMCFFLHSCKISCKQFFQVPSLFAKPQFWLWYINVAILSFDFPMAVVITKIINCSQHVKHSNRLQSLISIVALFLFIFQFPIALPLSALL